MSHFFLRPDGTLGRFGVVEVDQWGTIHSVTEAGDGFTETASVSFFGGLMIPGMIAPIREQGLNMALQRNGYLRMADAGRPGQEQWDAREYGSLAGDGVPEFFHLRSRQRALEIGRDKEWGVLAVGARPGIAVVEGFDLNLWKPIRTLIYRVLIG